MIPVFLEPIKFLLSDHAESVGNFVSASSPLFFTKIAAASVAVYHRMTGLCLFVNVLVSQNNSLKYHKIIFGLVIS